MVIAWSHNLIYILDDTGVCGEYKTNPVQNESLIVRVHISTDKCVLYCS